MKLFTKKKNSPFPLVGVRNGFTEEMTAKQDFERWIAVKYSLYCKVGVTEEIDVFSNDLIVITLTLLPRPSPKGLAEPVHACYHISPKPELIRMHQPPTIYRVGKWFIDLGGKNGNMTWEEIQSYFWGKYQNTVKANFLCHVSQMRISIKYSPKHQFMFLLTRGHFKIFKCY